MSLLQVDRIAASYGASQALFDVSLSLDQGEILALLGRNGMGKSTTIKSICRLLPVSSGTISIDGQDVTHLPSHKTARLGLGLVPEGRRCFHALSVDENLIAAARPGPWDRARVAQLFPRLEERRDQIAASLSGGEQQMLAIGRALMTNPRLLILDEATEGLAPMVRAEIWDALRLLKRDTGLAILIIDKSLRELSALADHAVILQRGASVWTGDMAQVQGAVANRYLGL